MWSEIEVLGGNGENGEDFEKFFVYTKKKISA